MKKPINKIKVLERLIAVALIMVQSQPTFSNDFLFDRVSDRFPDLCSGVHVCSVGDYKICDCGGEDVPETTNNEPGQVKGSSPKNNSDKKTSLSHDDDTFKDDDSREEGSQSSKEPQGKSSGKRNQEQEATYIAEIKTIEAKNENIVKAKQISQEHIQENKGTLKNESSRLNVFNNVSLSGQQITSNFQHTDETILKVRQNTNSFKSSFEGSSSILDSELESLKRTFQDTQNEALIGMRKSYVNSFKENLSRASNSSERIKALDRVSLEVEIIDTINSYIKKSPIPNHFGTHIESYEEELKSLYNEFYDIRYLVGNNEFATLLFRDQSFFCSGPTSIINRDISHAITEALLIPLRTANDTELQRTALFLTRMAFESSKNADDISQAYSFLHIVDQIMGFSKGFLRSSGENIIEAAEDIGEMSFAILTADNEDLVQFIMSTQEGIGYVFTNYDKVYEFIKQEVVRQQTKLINGTPEEQGAIAGAIVTNTLLFLVGDRVAVNLLKGVRTIGSAITKATYNAVGELINEGKI